MKILDAFNKVAPRLMAEAHQGRLHAVMYSMKDDVMAVAYNDAAAAKASADVLRGYGLNPIRLELQPAKKAEDCLKGYYVPVTTGFGRFP
jgi:hypothetical protein